MFEDKPRSSVAQRIIR